MLSQAPGNIVVLRGGQQAARPVREFGHVQRAVRDVGNPLPRRVDPRVSHRARGRYRFRYAGGSRGSSPTRSTHNRPSSANTTVRQSASAE